MQRPYARRSGALLLDLSDLSDLSADRADLPMATVARLLAYGQRHNSDLVGTLGSWLNSFSNVPARASSASRTVMRRSNTRPPMAR
jgi:hypothetical protein